MGEILNLIESVSGGSFLLLKQDYSSYFTDVGIKKDKGNVGS